MRPSFAIDSKSELPCAFVDLDAVDANIKTLSAACPQPIRLATKSVRVPELLRYIIDNSSGRVQGLMAFSIKEAAFLVQQGFKDVLVAYPTLQHLDLLNDEITITIDDPAHVHALGDRKANVVIDVDASWRLPFLHFGVRRSPLQAIEQVVRFAQTLPGNLTLRGLMSYEAQIAGLNKYHLLRKLSYRSLRKHREALAARLKPRLFNGAGSGSLTWAGREPWLTELTAGSGFLCSHLFDHLKLQPALFYAAEVTRHPAPGFVTVHGGGYVASGAPGRDRLPQPLQGTLLDAEGAGEVQTPLHLDAPIGTAVFFRPAKAGELAERFNEYALVRQGKVISRTPTYRGHGLAGLC